MKKLSLVVLLAAAIVGISVLSTYLVRRDEIASRRHAVDEAWNHAHAAMQRRADLVPALLAEVKATASQNRALAAEVEQSRVDVQSASTPVETIAANRRLDAAVARLLAAAQYDPNLIFNQKFFVVQDQWAAATNRITPERVRYDQAVQNYNSFITEFPNNVFARWASFPTMENYFAADANAASRTTAELMRK